MYTCPPQVPRPDDDGNTIDLTDEEKAAKKQELQDILDAARESGDLKAAVDAANENRDENSKLSASETTYGADSTTPAEEVRTAADALKDGELAADRGYRYRILRGTDGQHL